MATHSVRPKEYKYNSHGRFRLRASPAAVLLLAGTIAWAATARGGGLQPAALAMLGLAALLHEGGHIVAAWACGVRIAGMRLDLFGARLELPGLVSYRQELLVALGGPAANLLTVCMLLPAWMSSGYPLWGVTGDLAGGRLLLGCFVPASLGLCGINLLPVETLDGGRMVSSLLALWLDADVARCVMCCLSVAVLTGLWLISVYTLLRAGQFLSLFTLSFCLLVRCIEVPSTNRK